MTQTKAFLAIGIGCMMLIFAFCNKDFYAGKGIGSAALSERRIPTWAGRLLFVFIGLTAILVGISFFIYGGGQ
jgi:hypothetical protein